MDEVATLSGEVIASQAMENLVNQFARPMDFLRELAQNSMDAGTPRVDVVLEYEPEKAAGVLSIHVIDYGEGMDEAIIDGQLTRLFSSNKENDLTKIGKFGIGFTSIFAIKPEAVLLQTGRHGENWELLFHADRSYEKRAVDTPFSGTEITLFKRMTLQEAEAFAKEARFVLTYWCEHSEIPIQFENKVLETSQTQKVGPVADPFAAFERPSNASRVERIDGPLALSGVDLSISLNGPDWELIIGYGQTPRYGFYNGGLTLVSSQNPDLLGEHASALKHLTFKLKSDALEHTLTRDNVLKDGQWLRLMQVINQAHIQLRGSLIGQLSEAVLAGEDVDRWYGYLADEYQSGGAPLCGSKSARRAPLFLDAWGQGISLDELEAQETTFGAVLYHPGTTALAQALKDEGIRLLPDTPAVRSFVKVLKRPPFWGVYALPRLEVNAGDWFLIPELVSMPTLPFAERRFVEQATEWVHFASRKKVTLKLGEFGGEEEALTEGLVVMGPDDGKVFQRVRKGYFECKLTGGDTMLLNRHHPFYGAMLALHAEDPVSALYVFVTELFSKAELGTKNIQDILLGYACRVGEV